MTKIKKGGSYFDDDYEDNYEAGSEDVSNSEISDNDIDEDDDELKNEIDEDIEDDVEEDIEDDVEEDDVEDDEDNMQKGGDGDEDEDDEEDKEDTTKGKKIKKMPQRILDDDDDEDEDADGDNYLKKFDAEMNKNYIINYHPECALQNYDEIIAMTKITRDKNGIIVDDLHRTIPYLTKYEKARILGQRAKQINAGATPFVKVPENIIDGYLIAQMELEQKRIPFIIRRPLPNGGSEYWSLKDLENISF